jgi:hypothetical protein
MIRQVARTTNCICTTLLPQRTSVLSIVLVGEILAEEFQSPFSAGPFRLLKEALISAHTFLVCRKFVQLGGTETVYPVIVVLKPVEEQLVKIVGSSTAAPDVIVISASNGEPFTIRGCGLL